MVNNSSPALFLGKGSEWVLVDLTQQEENPKLQKKHLADKHNIAKTSKATHTGLVPKTAKTKRGLPKSGRDPLPGGFNPSNLYCKYFTGKDRERDHVSETD